MLRRVPVLLAGLLAVAGLAACSSSPTSPQTLTIASQPQSQTVSAGGTATLNVAGTGEGTLSYQWFLGPAGTTSAPIAGATAADYTTPALTSTTHYWVRVADARTTADSTTATITVLAVPGTPVIAPTIARQPDSATVSAGQTAFLYILSDGTAPFDYQWYTGPSGTTSSPIAGATNPSITTQPLMATTEFWVRIWNSAGGANSATATITVGSGSGAAPAIATQPQSQTIASGQTAALSVGATGAAPLAYQWFAGSSGNTSSPVAGATSANFTTPALTTTSTFWVQVSNGLGSVNSTTATITVSAGSGVLAFEDQVLTLVNQHRAAGATCGATPLPAVGPLTMNPNLRVAARAHSEDMGVNAYFSHTSLNGTTFDQRIRNAGYTGSSPLGENIAAGYATPAAVVAGWMTSPGHCTNIMSSGFQAIGVGYAFVTGSPFGHYWTQDFGGS